MVGKKYCSPSCENSPNLFSLSFTGSFSSAKQNSIPCACNASSNSATVSPAETSTLVTGSAATPSQRTGVGDFATASSTRSLKNSALAKNRGASHRNMTSPGIRLSSGYLAVTAYPLYTGERTKQH